MFKVYVTIPDDFDKKLKKYMSKFGKKYDFKFIYYSHDDDWTYDIIENEIASSDCYLAIASKITFDASTWRHIEITYAAGLCLSGCSSNTELINPKTIFIFPLDDKWETYTTKTVPNKIILSSNIKKALLELKNTLYKLFPDKV